MEYFWARFNSSSSSEMSPSVSNAGRDMFRFVPLLEGLYLLPYYQCCYSGSVMIARWYDAYIRKMIVWAIGGDQCKQMRASSNSS